MMTRIPTCDSFFFTATPFEIESEFQSELNHDLAFIYTLSAPVNVAFLQHLPSEISYLTRIGFRINWRHQIPRWL